MTRVSKKRTVARIRYSRGGREASATSIKVAGICASNIKAEELDTSCTGTVLDITLIRLNLWYDR
jgi:hypothetical protein